MVNETQEQEAEETEATDTEESIENEESDGNAAADLGLGAAETDPFLPEPQGIFSNVDLMRQITMIMALFVCLVIGVLILMWAMRPEYRPLAKFDMDELIPALDVLDKHNIDYELKQNVILVEDQQYQNIKLLLYREGILSESKDKDNFLKKDPGFGVSQRLEEARLKYNQETNLALAIEALKNVKRAKVILALPKNNVFARDKKMPSATVVLTIKQTGFLEQQEVDAVVDIVASAVQGMEPTRVTVTDQNGRLLNSGSQDNLSSRARREFELVQKKEAEYLAKIDDLLIPVIGREAFMAQVDVVMDFSAVEQTSKRYNPDMPAIRSEMLIEDENKGGIVAGIPGALTNQPPQPSNIPQVATGQPQPQPEQPTSLHSEATRNYELDTTISHTRQQVGIVRRISVSIAVNYKEVEKKPVLIPVPETKKEDKNKKNQNKKDDKKDEAKKPKVIEPVYIRVPRTQDELNNIRRLVEGAMGFSENRGDTIEVVNVKFLEDKPDKVPEPPFWEKEAFSKLMEIAGAGFLLLLLLIFVIRPLIQRLIHMDDEEGHELVDMEEEFAKEELGVLEDEADAKYTYGEDGSIEIPDLHKDEDMLQAIRALVLNEPELSIQVVKAWLSEDQNTR